MRTLKLLNWYRLSMIVVLAAVVCVSQAQAEQKADQPDAMSFAEKRNTGEATGQVLAGEEKVAFLKAHNDVRKAVGLEPLVWSNDIGKYSLSWIKHNHGEYFTAAVAGNLPPMKHRPYDGPFKQKYGENLAAWSGPGSTDTNARKAVALWLTEKADFDKLTDKKPYVTGDEKGQLDADGNPIIVGHYTQIVWRDTKQVGAARWTFKSKDQTVVVIVSNYDPPGNFIGRKPY